MTAAEYQREAEIKLNRHFQEVRREWSVTKDATDALMADIRRYAPRVDIAVGPFNTTPGHDGRINAGLLPRSFRRLFDGAPPNANPRCLLAIEVSFSGSSKHIMGDLLNAGAHGLYGLVVGKEELMPKISRIGVYLELLAKLEKLPPMFQNVVLLSVGDFDTLIR